MQLQSSSFVFFSFLFFFFSIELMKKIKVRCVRRFDDDDFHCPHGLMIIVVFAQPSYRIEYAYLLLWNIVWYVSHVNCKHVILYYQE